ncbi:uncharacterized protein LOC130913423 [Corythoichthys intestinalis]|uniref:uncharacterized protein LOC130913423 n=1 Tax=Corythoichthys intestinalis TaxID=161448 RepID=UPI0025A52EEE|nr:uncharacterized protein LOC130913423 [Corythoichthys intestinalis]
MLKDLVKQRLSAAADEIFALFEQTIASYEEQLCRAREDNATQRPQLETVYKSHVVLCAEDIQQLISHQQVHLQLQEGSSILEHKDPLSPNIQQQKHPQPLHVKEEDVYIQRPHIREEDLGLQTLGVIHIEEESIDTQLPHEMEGGVPQPLPVRREDVELECPHIKEEDDNLQHQHIKEEEMYLELPRVEEVKSQALHVREGEEGPQAFHIYNEEKDVQHSYIEEEMDPQIPHVEEEEEEPQPLDFWEDEEEMEESQHTDIQQAVSNFPLTDGSVKSKEKEDSPPRKSMFNQHYPSGEHNTGPSLASTFPPLSESDKVPLRRHKNCTDDEQLESFAKETTLGIKKNYQTRGKGIMSRRRSRKKPPLQDAKEHAVKALDKTAELEARFNESLKGRGVFAKVQFQKGDFVVEYRGELINSEESKRRRTTNRKACALFMCDFLWKESTWCIDAAKDDGSLGRLVSPDQRNPNCKMKRVMAKGKPHLCLFASRDIEPGDQITYDFGEQYLPCIKQVWDDPKLLSQVKVRIITHRIDSSVSDKLQNLKGSNQKKLQTPLDSDEHFYSNLNDKSEESLSQSDIASSANDANNMRLSGDQKQRLQSSPNAENMTDDQDGYATSKRKHSPLENKKPSSKRQRRYSSSESNSSTNTSVCEPSKARETGALSENLAPDMEKDGPDLACSLDGFSLDSLSVPGISRREDGSRIYNKRQYCFYCKAGVIKIGRHLLHAHKDKQEVARALSFSKGSKERRRCLDHLRNMGNFAHNVNVLNSGIGTPVPCYRPKNKAQAHNYKHCTYCQGFFPRKFLWKHVKICKFLPKNLPKPGRTRTQARIQYTTPPPGVQEPLWKLINGMHQDDVQVVVKSDPWIMAYGQNLYNRLGDDISKHEYIRQEMRGLGRLLICSRKNSAMKTMKDHIRPSNFMHLVQSVKETAGYSCETHTYKSPSLALRIGRILDRISKMVIRGANVQCDSSVLNDVRAFRREYQSKWHELVTLPVTLRSKCTVPQLLPFTKDVQALHSYLDDQRQDLFQKLSSDSSAMTYTKLTKVILTKVILFNRPRAVEVSKIPLSAYKSSNLSHKTEDVNFALSGLENTFYQNFKRIEVKGSSDRKAPILLTQAMQQALDLLVRKRQDCGVPPGNTYLFAKPFTKACYSGSLILHYFTKDCGAKSPESLTSKYLQRQIRALSRVLDFTKTEMDQLSDFLGYDISLQQQMYQLPEGTLQLAKIGKVLMALEDGHLTEMKGKSVDDLHIDPEENVQLDRKRFRSLDETDESDTQDDEVTAERSHTTEPDVQQDSVTQSTNHDKALKSKEQEGRKRKKWDDEEVAAVERHLMSFISSCQLPRKIDCQKCLKKEKMALRSRDWKSIKFYIKNRITACKRKA